MECQTPSPLFRGDIFVSKAPVLFRLQPVREPGTGGASLDRNKNTKVSLTQPVQC